MRKLITRATAIGLTLSGVALVLARDTPPGRAVRGAAAAAGRRVRSLRDASKDVRDRLGGRD
jgi:hypothetical protein